MRPLRYLSMVCCLLAAVAYANGQTGDTVNNKRVFVGSTPCSQGTRPLPGMVSDAPCELMKWTLTLYNNTFTLDCSYGLPLQGTKGLVDSGRKLNLTGNWQLVTGVPGNPQATVYRLTDSATGKTFCLLKLSDDVLHLLDESGRLMIGNAGWSYTLNRIK